MVYLKANMDASRTKNNSLVEKPICFNKKNSSPGVDSIAIGIDENNSNTDDKSSLPTKKQRIKEYLTTHSSDISTVGACAQKLNPVVELVNTLPKINDRENPFKVKSRWTQINQMEKALGNTVFNQSENMSLESNSSRSPEAIKEAFGNFVPLSKEFLDKDQKFIQLPHINFNFINQCSVLVRKLDDSLIPVQEKKKRGRPRKNIALDKKKVPIASKIDSKRLIKSKSVTGLKSTVTVAPTVKRGRGRPKKNGMTSNIVPSTSKVVSKKVLPKKRGRKKCDITNIETCTDKVKSTVLENEATSEVSNDFESSKLDNHESSDCFNIKMIPVDEVLMNESPTTIGESEMKENNIIIAKTASQTRLDCSDIERNTESITVARVKTTEYCSDYNEQDVLIKFGKVREKILPQRRRSSSISDNEFTKRRHRRYSLPGNFALSCSSVLPKTIDEPIDEPMQLTKSWKSLSYLESGPNIQVERYQQDQLYKKFRTELKRSRSFPNCMLLDTVIWRFLVYEEDSEPEDNDNVLSDSEVDLPNELPLDEYDREYRSKSVTIEQSEDEAENNEPMSESLDSLDISLSVDDLSSIQINQCDEPDECEEEDSDSEIEERQRNIRRSKRIRIKQKRFKKINKKYFLECENLKKASLLLGEQIREESEKQLFEAKRNDPELDKKLTKLNFTFINNSLFRPHKKNMSKYTQAELQELRKLKHRKVFSTYLIRCECKYSEEDWINGKQGCGSNCVNRALNVECGPWCPIKSFCTNKQFQNKQFKRTEILRTPDKGFGVFAREDIASGDFIEEYVGEVIDHSQMIKRMRTKLYANNNYMVQLKHNEIIDATCKGNVTRFINHSCEPNCSAEKWIVAGESRMGFFSTESISKGEEITFDYGFQFFGKTTQQNCYCGALKCRGLIGTKSRNVDFSSSDESEEDDIDMLISKPEEWREKKKKLLSKRIANKEKKRLRELNQQLTDISKLKNKSRSDMESSTLNLNKLMVHITDSMSRSHILKFIRENDLNCKRLFMNFNGLSIIYSWMISSNNENLRLEIVQTLSDLPISNRNTITKSKVIDMIAEWANIPPNTKDVIENLDYPVSKSEEHGIEVDQLLPDDKRVSLLAQNARILWKKWIILKMAFKIPKLERPKEVVTPNVISKSSTKLSKSTPKPDNHHLGKLLIPASKHSKLNHNQIENKLNRNKNVKSQKLAPDNELTNSMDKFSKIIHHQNLINNQEKNKAVREWNKRNWEYAAFKTNKVDNSVGVKNSNNFVLKKNSASSRLFESRNVQQEIPTIENIPIQKIKQPTVSKFVPGVFEVPTNSLRKSNTATNIIETRPINYYYPIEEITTRNKLQCPPVPVPTIFELQNESTLDSIIKLPPPLQMPTNVTQQYSKSSSLPWTIMRPENVEYEAQYPSQYEQAAVYNPNIVFNVLSDTSFEATVSMPFENPSSYYNNTVIIEPSEETALIPFKTTVNNNTNVLINLTDAGSDRKAKRSSKEDIEKYLLRQCDYNLKKLYDRGLIDSCKSARENYVDMSPMKISPSFFKIKNNCNFLLPNFFKCLKVASNFYREQPCKMIKINELKWKFLNKNNIFRIKEEKKTEKNDPISIALNLPKKQMKTAPENLNLRKIFKKQTIKLKTENKLACKLLNGLRKKCLSMPKQFTLQLPPDTQIYTQDPTKELEFHHKLIPKVENKLCARLRKGDAKDTINVFKQQITMKYDDSKVPRTFTSLESIFKANMEKMKNAERNNYNKSIKRKLPLPEIHDMKIKKICDSSTSLISTPKNQVPATSQLDDDAIFKKPMVPPLRNNAHRNRVAGQRRLKATSSNKVTYVAPSHGNKNAITLGPSTSNQTIASTDLLKINANKIGQKPLMKCLPFNKVNNISSSELEQNARNLAYNLSMGVINNAAPLTQSKGELIDPIVNQFNASLSVKKTKGRTHIADDPIVRDYMLNQEDSSEPKRKYKLPESMMSLPVEVLNLVPDNQRDIKYIVDFYHSMATVIVRVLDAYVKKSCQQGRIKNDDDFKFLAKKLNSNILYKELQVKKVEDLRISESVKQKVEQYIKKYMMKYGKLYRRKSSDQ